MKKRAFPSCGGETDKKVRGRFEDMMAHDDLFIKVFPQSRVGKIKKKDMCYLIGKGDEYVLVKLRLVRPAKVETIPKSGVSAEVETGLLSNSIRIKDSAGNTACVLTFSKVYNDDMDKIKGDL